MQTRGGNEKRRPKRAVREDERRRCTSVVAEFK